MSDFFWGGDGRTDDGVAAAAHLLTQTLQQTLNPSEVVDNNDAEMADDPTCSSNSSSSSSSSDSD